MTITILSFLILIIGAFLIVNGAIKGIKKDVGKTLVNIISIFVSVCISVMIAKSVIESNEILIPFVTTFDIKITFDDSSNTIAQLINSFLTQAIIFIPFYFIVKLILSFFIFIAYKKGERNDAYKFSYQSVSESYNKNKRKGYCALLGGLSGFLTLIIIFAPIVGAVKTAKKIVDITALTDSSFVFENSELLNEMNYYNNDVLSNVIYVCGGSLLFDSITAFKIEGQKTSLKNELKVLNNADDILSGFFNLSSLDDENIKKLQNSLKTIDKSIILRSLVANSFGDIVNDKFLTINEVNTLTKNPLLTSVFDRIVNCTYKSSQRTVVVDINCLLNFIELLKETPWDNDNYLNTNLKLLLGDNENTGLLDRIKFNFYQSETFYECSYEIDQIALKYIVNKIRQCFTEDGYLLLVEELAKTLNDTIYYDFNSRIYYITQTLDEKLQSVDITAKQTVLNVISEDIVVQFQGFFQVSSYDVYNYLSYYTISNNYMLAN